jgi:hypothetical protein
MMIDVSNAARTPPIAGRQPSILPQVVSHETGYIISTLQRLRLGVTPGSVPLESAREAPLNEQLYDALARAKMLTSAVAMHLDRAWRTKLFQQLDALHDLEEWEKGDAPLHQGSFSTFLRTIIALNPVRRPGLGLTHTGDLIAAWTTGRDRLTLEFLPSGTIRWLLACYDDERIERAAGEVSVARLMAVLSPYLPARWFGGDASQSSA